MKCTHVKLPNGHGIICTSRRQKRCVCGAVATLECDWKVPTKRSGTCDKGICANCTHRPAEGKDLCPKHAAEWRKRLEIREQQKKAGR